MRSTFSYFLSLALVYSLLHACGSPPNENPAVPVPADKKKTKQDPANDGYASPKRLQGTKKTQKEMIRLLLEAGFRPPEIPVMVCVAKYESAFYERATHLNRNGSIDHGLFQINDRWWGLRAENGCGYSNAQLLVAHYNARCARKVFLRQGLRAWRAYHLHKKECDHYML